MNSENRADSVLAGLSFLAFRNASGTLPGVFLFNRIAYPITMKNTLKKYDM